MQTDALLVHLQFLQYHVLSDSKPLVSCAVCLNILVLNMYSVTVFQGSVYPEQTLFFFAQTLAINAKVRHFYKEMKMFGTLNFTCNSCS